MIIHPTIAQEIRNYRRQVVGDFMDAHPAIFAPPVLAHRWVDFFSQTEEVNEFDRSTAEKALGMFAQVFRHAQHDLLLDASMRLEEFMSSENFPGLEEVVVPDPVALFIGGGEDPSEHTTDVVAFARAISLLKFLVQSGAVPADFMLQAMCQALDNLPGRSALQRSLVEAIKQLLQRDMEVMLRCDVVESLR